MSGDFEYRIGRSREAWEASRVGPYVTIRAGGPLDRVVTLTAAQSGALVIVAATWGDPRQPSSMTAARIGHAAADELAQAWANQFVVGREPTAD